jgi:hypothetical protein
MPWSQFLTSPIVLRDGRVLVTLRDAANLFTGLSESHLAQDWSSHAIDLLMKAAEDGSPGATENATRQVQRALFREGML